MKMINKFRKYFNILSKEQETIIYNQYLTILNVCIDIRDEKNANQIKFENNYNCTCPKCKSTNVINKIITNIKSIKHSNTLHPRFAFQKPITTYYTTNYSENEEINHCNDCGNEWCKGKNFRFTVDNVFKEKFGFILLTPFSSTRIEYFNDFYAETIYYMVHERFGRVFSDVLKDKYSLKNLREQYKSIYDN